MQANGPQAVPVTRLAFRYLRFVIFLVSLCFRLVTFFISPCFRLVIFLLSPCFRLVTFLLSPCFRLVTFLFQDVSDWSHSFCPNVSNWSHSFCPHVSDWSHSFSTMFPIGHIPFVSMFPIGHIPFVPMFPIGHIPFSPCFRLVTFLLSPCFRLVTFLFPHVSYWSHSFQPVISSPSSLQCRSYSFNPEDEGILLLRNVDVSLQHYVMPDTQNIAAPKISAAKTRKPLSSQCFGICPETIFLQLSERKHLLNFFSFLLF
jgi:hypothetical protein